MNVSDTATPPNLFNIPGRIPLPNTLPAAGPPFAAIPVHGILKKPPPVVVEPVSSFLINPHILILTTKFSLRFKRNELKARKKNLRAAHLALRQI